MKEDLEITGGGVKCDNTTCDYRDEDVKMEDWVKYIDEPCPKCGENLMTQEDFDMTQLFIGMANMINGMSDDERADYMKSVGIDPVIDKSDKMVNMRIDVHNKEIEITDIDEDE